MSPSSGTPMRLIELSAAKRVMLNLLISSVISSLLVSGTRCQGKQIALSPLCGPLELFEVPDVASRGSRGLQLPLSSETKGSLSLQAGIAPYQGRMKRSRSMHGGTGSALLSVLSSHSSFAHPPLAVQSPASATSPPYPRFALPFTTRVDALLHQSHRARFVTRHDGHRLARRHRRSKRRAGLRSSRCRFV